MSYIDFIDKVDTFTYEKDHKYYSLIAHDGDAEIGYLTLTIAKHFEKNNAFSVDHASKTVVIGKQYDTLEKRNTLFAEVGNQWRKLPEFNVELDKGWRNELYTIYNPSTVPYMQIERAFSVLLGVITYGVHLNGYVLEKNTTDKKLKLWVPRRSYQKPTYPGMLDNTVAGGLGYPYGIWETVVKECYEEAGLQEDFVKKNTRSAGVVLYMYQPNGPEGNVQPEVEYIFDIEFPNEEEVIPKPIDGEAQDFKLMPVDEVLERIKNNEFKPNCSLVIIDFLIRFGYITPESEPNYLQIVAKSHRRMPFPTL